MSQGEFPKQEDSERWPVWVQRVVFVSLLGFFLLFWVCAFVWVLFRSLVGRFSLPEEKRADAGRRLVCSTFLVLSSCLRATGAIRVKTHGMEAMRNMEEPLMIAPNHPALWDVVFILAECGNAACIMKSDLMRNPLVASGASFAGFLPNAPHTAMVKSAVGHLRSGGSLLIFPEGTRTREGGESVNDFRPGVALIARASRAAVLPVFIRTDSAYLSKGWSLWRPPNLPIHIDISAGEIQRVATDEKTRPFSERLEALYRQELESAGREV